MDLKDSNLIKNINNVRMAFCYISNHILFYLDLLVLINPFACKPIELIFCVTESEKFELLISLHIPRICLCIGIDDSYDICFSITSS